VAGRIDDVYLVLAPVRRRGGALDGDAAFLLLLHPVHHGLAVVDFADLVGLAGIIEYALRRRGLARVDVRHDADISRCTKVHAVAPGATIDGMARFLQG
jgi:hypothetical protein